MIIKSYSKINLSLRILNKKKKNRLHDIETNSVLVNLHDKIDIKRNKKDIIIFKGRFKKEINKNNTVFETIKILKELKLIHHSYKIVIKKNIPVYGGLGGGTGNSVALAKHFLKNKLNEKRIKLFEERIGSDFRLFLNSFSSQKNLRKVIKNKNKFKCYFIIVFPFINCKTKKIYKLVKYFSKSSFSAYLKKQNQLDLMNIFKKDRNDLQKVVEKKYPKISKLIILISKQEGCLFSRMTGSGSSCYGVFDNIRTAKLALTKLKRKYPKYWCDITKTI